MTLLFILLLSLLLFIFLLFTVASRIDLSYDSARSDMHLTLRWLHPLLRSVIVKEGNGFLLLVYLLKKRVLAKLMKPKQYTKRSGNILKSLKPTEIHVNTQYGFRDPFVTGLACGAVSAVSQLLNVESLHQKPDFLANSDYINLDATAKLNLGRLLMKLI
ncbi:MAG TPA: hypothetical protein PKU88_00295 [Bacillota bacterium]|nr:hypothetical protein [Bacillota bacterium]HNT02955.1 hypothetical protein [Bacillota bacterium]HPX67761.1 hypothetical protein [Bacillota bacterium]HQA64334.1 hypothetical protein [Bacillota bacterium]